jgi:hypothetical protein
VALALCRALTVLCVAPDADALGDLRRATVSADWELAPGATDLRAALDQIDEERPHVLVAFGSWGELIRLTRERFPGMRIVTDRDAPGATAVASSLEEVRSLVKDLPRPGGPVG